MSTAPILQSVKNYFHTETEAEKTVKALKKEVDTLKDILQSEEDEELEVETKGIEVEDTEEIYETQSKDSPYIIINIEERKLSRKERLANQVNKINELMATTKTAQDTLAFNPLGGPSGQRLLRFFQVGTAVTFVGTVVITVISAVTSTSWNLVVAIGSLAFLVLGGATTGTWYIFSEIDNSMAELKGLSPYQIVILKKIADGEIQFITGLEKAEASPSEEKCQKIIEKHTDESLDILREVDLSKHPEVKELEEKIREKQADPETRKEEVKELQTQLTSLTAKLEGEREELEKIKDKVICKRIIKNLGPDHVLFMSLKGVFDGNPPPPVDATPKTIKRGSKFTKSEPLTPGPHIRRKIHFSSAMTLAESEKQAKEKPVEEDELPSDPQNTDIDEASRPGLIEMRSEEDQKLINRRAHFERLCAGLRMDVKNLYYQNEALRVS